MTELIHGNFGRKKGEDKVIEREIINDDALFEPAVDPSPNAETLGEHLQPVPNAEIDPERRDEEKINELTEALADIADANARFPGMRVNAARTAAMVMREINNGELAEA